MSSLQCAAVVLAAGESSRMGQIKALLPLGRQTLIEHVIASLRAGGVGDIVVVVGHHGPQVLPVLRRAAVRTATNPNPRQGMFSSVRSGVRAVPTDIQGFFLLPVDIPLVRPWTLRYLQTRFTPAAHALVHPCFQGRRGHPPLIAGHLIAEILAGRDPDGGLASLLAGRPAIDVEVPDRNVLFDVDTPADYRELQNRWRRRQVPTLQECHVILSRIHPVADDVRAHSLKVAGVADLIVRALARAGVVLDREMIQAAALLHDLARGQKNHAAVGRRILEQMGFDDTAALVGTHMDLVREPGAALDAAGVLYLADKMVRGDRLVPLETRFAAALKRFGGDPEARRQIALRQRQAEVIRAQIEGRIGASLSSLLEQD